MSVTHVYKEWLILPSLIHLAKSDPFCPEWLIVPSATLFMCDPCVESVTHSPKFNLFGQMWPILHTVTDTSKGENFDERHPCL